MTTAARAPGRDLGCASRTGLRRAIERLRLLGSALLPRRHRMERLERIPGIASLPSIRRRLVVLASALVVAAGGAGAASTLYRAAAERSAIEEHVATLARFTAHSIDREHAVAATLLSTLAASPALRSGDFASFYRIASAVPRPAGSQIVVADLSGRQLVNTLRPFGYPHEPPSDRWRAMLADIAEHRQPVAFDLFYARLRHEWVVGLALPIVEEDQVRYVLAIVIPSSSLLQILDEHERPTEWGAGIVDRLGQSIVFARARERLLAQPGTTELAAGIGAAPSGGFAARLHDGTPVEVAYARSASSGWTAVVAVPLAALGAPLRTSLEGLAIGGTILLLSAVSVALFVGGGISRPVERQLRLGEERFRAMANTTPAMLFIAAPDGSVEYANDRFYEVTGAERVAEGAAIAWRRFAHPADVGSLEATWQNCLRTGRPFRGEFRLLDRAGVYRWYAARSKPIRNAEGEITQWFGASVDIDALKQGEQALRASNDRLAAILASISECYFTLDFDGRFIDWNVHFERWIAKRGVGPAALICQRFSEAFPALGGTAMGAGFEAALAAASPVTFEAESPLAPERWLEIRVYPARDGHSVFFRDTTDRKATELSLQRARELLQSTMDALSARVVILDRPGRILAVNEAWRRESRERLVGGDDSGLDAEYRALCSDPRWALPEWAPVERGLQAVLDGGSEGFRLEYSSGTGTNARWFQLRLSRFGCSDALRVVLAHEDITEIQLSALALQQVSDRLISLQDEERRRIARELHDSTAQNLAAAAMLADRLGNARTTPRDVPLLAEEVASLVRQALGEIRSFSFLLYPPILEEGGLAMALRTYASGFSKRCGILVDADLPSSIDGVPREIESAVLRVVQESLTNIHRHAEASCAAIRLRLKETRLVLEIEDDGKGFVLDPEDSRSVDLGVGIPGMRARLRQFGGGLDVSSSPRGTSIRAVFPLKPARDSARATV